MKVFYSLLLLLSSIVGGFAQKSLVPKEFQNESVVILEVSNVFKYTKYKVYNTELVSKKYVKVYLNDKNAVSKYSTFYTTKTSVNDNLVLTITKPDNSKRTFSFTDGIEEQENVTIPGFFKSNLKVGKYYKFALPNLEPGDVIEYTIENHYIFDSVTLNQNLTVFMRGDFPIVVNKVKIEMELNSYFLFFHSALGAPAYVKESDKKMLYYSIKDTLLPKIENDWKLPREVYIPHIKFNIAVDGYTMNSAFRITDYDIKERGTLKEQDLIDIISTFNSNPNNNLYVGFLADKIVKEVLENNSNLNSQNDYEEIIRLSWHRLRYKIMHGEKITKQYDEDISGGMHFYFTIILYRIIKRYNQNCDIFVCTDNMSLPITEVISPRELYWGVRYKDNYMTFPNELYMQYGELSNQFQGQNGYAITNYSHTLKKDKIIFSPIQLPSRNYKENILTEKVSVKLNLDNEPKIICNRELTSQKGFSGIYVPLYYNVNFDLSQLNYLHMNTIDSVSMYKGLNKNLNEQKKYNDQEIIANYYKDLKDSYQDILKSNYSNVDEYLSWKISSYGVTPDQPNFQIEETFSMEDMVTKVGNGYLIKLGLLVGKYTRFVEEDRIRNYGGMLDLTSTKQIEITFTIPEGYKLSSNDEFNRSYTSSFVDINSSIKTEGNLVRIIITRDFKKQTFTKEEYQDVLKFYDMMFELSQGKIVIKK